MTIEANETMKDEGDLIQSLYKYGDILSRGTYIMKLFDWFCVRDRSMNLKKVS